MKVIVAMSGGVDSSVAAALLTREGHEAIGVTMKLLPRGGEGFGCCGSPDDVLLAKRSAEKIGIPHYVLDYSADFEKNVIDYFVNSYVVGETPNPCLACNRHIKFNKLKNFASSAGATHIATGHYARIVSNRLFEAKDPSKDQSYVLYNFNQEALATTLFPVGHQPKSEIRSLAREFGLPNADKKDSQEICFVPKKDYGAFVTIKMQQKAAAIPATMTPGPIKNASGTVVGEHKGITYYTVGQRQGLGLSGHDRMYVTQLDARTNTIVVGPDEEGKSHGLQAVDFNWIQGNPPANEFSALVKIRYKHEPTPGQIKINAGDASVDVRFETSQRAVTPGQAVVIYRWDEEVGAREVLGGGKIRCAL